MLRNRFFGPGFNPLKTPLRAGAVIGGFSVNGIRGLKYTGGRYYIWGTTSLGTNFIATSTNLTTWTGFSSSGVTYNDVTSNGTVTIIVGNSTSFGPTVWTVNPDLNVGSLNFYNPAGLSIPRYVEWCSGFSRFIISAATNRAYSTSATGTTWTVANYTGSTYSPGSLLYSPEIGAYYDMRVSTTTAQYEVYTGATAAALSSVYAGGNTSNTFTNRRKLFYRAGPSGAHQVSVFSQTHFDPSPGYSILSVDVWNSAFSSVYATINNVQASISDLVGATYIPSHSAYIGRFSSGFLAAIIVANPTTISTYSPYNSTSFLPTASVSDANTLIYSPAGMVTASDTAQIYTNP